MGFDKILISTGKPKFDFYDDFMRRDSFIGQEAFSIELVRISGLISLLEMKFVCRTKKEALSFPLFKYKMEMIKEDGFYYWDTSKIKELSNLMIDENLLLKIEYALDGLQYEVVAEDYEITLYCSTVPMKH